MASWPIFSDITRRGLGIVALALLFTIFRPATGAAQTAVDLDLVLAVDASGSVNQERFELQKRGYVAAFRDPRVLEAIRAGALQRIGVTMMQWTGPTLQVQVLDWTMIRDAESAETVAAAIDKAPRALFGGGTSVSGAIDFSRALLARSPFHGAWRIIDISGDGANNRGRSAEAARDEAVAAGIGINGLPILSVEPDLDSYYRESVIGGPGAFMIAVQSYDDFAQAILNKLITEIAALDSPLHGISLKHALLSQSTH